MTELEILKNLQNNNIDTQSALERFLDNKEMYIKFIKQFSFDPSFNQIEEYITDKNWEQAFELAHSLKGVTGNLGMTALFDAFSKISVAYRNKNYSEMERLYFETKKEYINICKLITNLSK
jgi:HPt (histidine-containing phosphotransfer) domain-containing protein